LMIAGGMAEWSMAVVLKTTKVQAFGGSNPSPSATFEFDAPSRAIRRWGGGLTGCGGPAVIPA
jgi:hypothetical protein